MTDATTDVTMLQRKRSKINHKMKGNLDGTVHIKSMEAINSEVTTFKIKVYCRVETKIHWRRRSTKRRQMSWFKPRVLSEPVCCCFCWSRMCPELWFQWNHRNQ